jgi:HEAT repeat protein
MALGNIGPPAIPALIEVLRNKEEIVRDAVATPPVTAGQQIIPDVIVLHHGEMDNVRIGAVSSLVKIGPPAIPALTELFRGEDPQLITKVQQDAQLALRMIGLPAIPTLIVLLRDEHANVRIDAALTLGLIGPPSIPFLIELLHDKDWRVRHAAIVALGVMGSKAKVVIPSLVELLQDKENKIRQYAAQALEMIKEEKNE